MICDVASYLVAMYYMKIFNSVENMVMYWDEPTIGMDREPEEEDPLHHLIHRVWAMNQIPNIVLSCATLPKPDEIGGALQDFRSKFAEMEGEIRAPEIHVIDSHDCKKTISLIGKDGKIALPHLLFPKYKDLITECVEHCELNKSLLRYFDVPEIVRFIEHVQSVLREDARIERRFKSIDAVTLHSIKQYYLYVLREIPEENWPAIYQYMMESLKPRFGAMEHQGVDIRKIKSVSSTPSMAADNVSQGFAESISPKGDGRSQSAIFRRVSEGDSHENVAITRQSSVSYLNTTPNPTSANPTPANPAAGILLTTVDAHTLTDGPTIYLAEDVEKIGRFYIQQSKIPETVFATIQQKIEKNNVILRQVQKIEREVELKTVVSGGGDSGEKGSKKAEKEPMSKEVQRMLDQIRGFREAMQTVHLNAMYIPNTKQHLEIWTRDTKTSNSFAPNVDEEDVREIMALEVENQQKLLLILGIGVFSKTTDKQYAEIMKRLAYEQRLFLIIADSDYIYGTNYQFCHGFIGKDLTNMTQQKTVQAIGRIGRNNIQQEYTVRFRDDAVLMRLFKMATGNLEAETMNRLFCSEE
jgi:hypothetical protein